jgi:hypothetical protein
MSSDLPRKNIVLKSEKQVLDFEKFVKDGGFGNFSQMCRQVIVEAMKRHYNGSSEEANLLKDTLDSYHDSMHKSLELLNERVELIGMRINKEGITSEVGHAIRDIQKLLSQREMDHSQILAKCRKYDDKTKDAAICLLLEAENIGMYKKKKEKQKEVNQNEKNE